MIIDTWYDRRTRSYVVQLKDYEGNQIGDAEWFGNKDDRDKAIERIKLQTGANVATDALTKAKENYRKKTKQVAVEFNLETENDIFEFLCSKDSKAGYIKNLIRNDMNRK